MKIRTDSNLWEETQFVMYADDEEWEAIQRIPKIDALRSIIRIQLLDRSVWGLRNLVCPATINYLAQQKSEDLH